MTSRPTTDSADPLTADADRAADAHASPVAVLPERPAEVREVPEEVRRRLVPPMPRDRYSWLATGLVVTIAAILRLVGLSHPKGKIFDELYYATEADELLKHGVEWRPENNAGDFVVHPPLGKWCIALGEKIFGYDEFGWRIAAVVAGTISVLLIVRIARRLFRSTVLGCAAGLLVALDGMHFVLSRAALLDIFLMTFIVAAFGCLVLDREQRRRRWLRLLERGFDPSVSWQWPRLGVPWWRIAAGVFMGAACAVKWSGLWYLAALLVLMALWEVGARKSAGLRHPWLEGLVHSIMWGAAFIGLAILTYIASWSGWFATDTGWDRHWLAAQGRSEPPVIGPLVNLWHYHVEAWNFHTKLTTKHTYQSWPWQWLLLGRPVSFYYNGDGPCGATQCSSEVLLLGTPVLWWSFIPALAALTWIGISRRDWRAGAIGLLAAAGIVPWFWYELSNRTMFYFYALPAEPFLVLAVVYVLGAIIGPAPRRTATGSVLSDRRLVGVVIAAIYLVAVAVCFAYFYPIYVAEIMTYTDWWARMWLGTRWV